MSLKSFTGGDKVRLLFQSGPGGKSGETIRVGARLKSGGAEQAALRPFLLPLLPPAKVSLLWLSTCRPGGPGDVTPRERVPELPRVGCSLPPPGGPPGSHPSGAALSRGGLKPQRLGNLGRPVRLGERLGERPRVTLQNRSDLIWKMRGLGWVSFSPQLTTQPTEMLF